MNEGFKNVTIEDLLVHVRDGKTSKEVAREYGRTRHALTAYLKKYGLSFMDLQLMALQEAK